MATEYDPTFYGEMKKIRMGFHGIRNVLIDSSYWNVELFLGFVQFFSVEKVMTLNNKALVAYSIHPIFLNLFPRRRKWLKKRAYTGGISTSISY